MGRKRILCLGGDPNLYTIRERVKGYNAALTAAGLETMVEMEASDYASAEAAIMKHMSAQGKIDAIFGLYNQSTIHAYEVMQNHNISVPECVSFGRVRRFLACRHASSVDNRGSAVNRRTGPDSDTAPTESHGR